MHRQLRRAGAGCLRARGASLGDARRANTRGARGRPRHGHSLRRPPTHDSSPAGRSHARRGRPEEAREAGHECARGRDHTTHTRRPHTRRRRAGAHRVSPRSSQASPLLPPGPAPPPASRSRCHAPHLRHAQAAAQGRVPGRGQRALDDPGRWVRNRRREERWREGAHGAPRAQRRAHARARARHRRPPTHAPTSHHSLDDKIKKLDAQLVPLREAIRKARPGPAQDAAKRRALQVGEERERGGVAGGGGGAKKKRADTTPSLHPPYPSSGPQAEEAVRITARRPVQPAVQHGADDLCAAVGQGHGRHGVGDARGGHGTEDRDEGQEPGRVVHREASGEREEGGGE